MASRDEAYISPWHKGVLIPFWVLQLLAILNAIGISGAGISNYWTYYYHLDYNQEPGDQMAVKFVILVYFTDLRLQQLC
jgi:hypothetical protein